MGVKLTILILLLGTAAGCAMPTRGTWRLYQDGTEIGTYKATDVLIPAVVIVQDGNGNQQAVQNMAFPGAAVPREPRWHTAHSHGHANSDILIGPPPDQYLWVVGGITEVYVAD